jgi:acyl carrier protein
VDFEGSSVAEEPSTTDLILRILASVKPECEFSEHEMFTGNQLLDSLDLIRTVGELDGAFDISIQGFELVPQNFESVKAISALVQKYKKAVSPDG